MPKLEREIEGTSFVVQTYEAGFMDTGVMVYRDGELIFQDPCHLNTDSFGMGEEDDENQTFDEYLEELVDRYFEDIVEMAEARCAWL